MLTVTGHIADNLLPGNMLPWCKCDLKEGNLHFVMTLSHNITLNVIDPFFYLSNVLITFYLFVLLFRAVCIQMSTL